MYLYNNLLCTRGLLYTYSREMHDLSCFNQSKVFSLSKENDFIHSIFFASTSCIKGKII